MKHFAVRTSRSIARCTAPRRFMSAQAVKDRVLVTGASGQIGTELIPALRQIYGSENVIASDVHFREPIENSVILDVKDGEKMAALVADKKITYIVHLASMLSAVGERDPYSAMILNTRGIENVLEIARTQYVRVFAPSTIAAFGPSTPRINTPDLTIMRPTTIYGVTKVYLELLGEYYYTKFGVDFRSVRFPGILSTKCLPGGGTTDYAVDIYHKAVLGEDNFKCFLKADSALPMMMMSDCIDSVTQLMQADPAKLSQCTYNVGCLSVTPKQFFESIKKHYPNYTIDYVPDTRQQIADSWPASLDDAHARKDWGWNPKINTVDALTIEMLDGIKEFYETAHPSVKAAALAALAKAPTATPKV